MTSKITLLASAILLIANITVPTFSLAQVTQEWVARYNGTVEIYDHARAVAVDDSGNVYVTGYNSGSNSGTYSLTDYVTVKYNSTGIEQWVAIYNEMQTGNSLDCAYALAVDGSGNVYVTGRSIGNGTSRDYATIKYNSSGVQLWVARYNGPANEEDDAYALAVDGSGNVYVTGTSKGNGSGFDYATVKYDSSGVQQWASRRNGPSNGNDAGKSIALDGSGNVYITGSLSAQGLSLDYGTIKYDSAGVLQWDALYNGPANYLDHAEAIVVDNSGNVYVTGGSMGGNSTDYATIKYNSSGVQQWVKRYNGPGNSADHAHSLSVDGSGNVYVTGKSNAIGQLFPSDYDYATIKYDSTGIQQWVTRYNGPGNGDDVASSLAMDSSRNVYVTGYSLGSGSGLDYVTIKYDSTGVQQWLERYNGPGNGDDLASALVVFSLPTLPTTTLALDDSGNVYVTGLSLGIGTADDYATIKYSQQPASVHTETIPAEISLLQLFPNPATNQLTIAWGSNNGKVEVAITDITGKIVYSTIASDPDSYREQKIEVNTNDFASGIYVVQIQAADFIETKKLVIEK